MAATLRDMVMVGPVFRKYHIGDHVGLAEILAVGTVIARRGVVPGVGGDNGSGRYHVEFDGVPQDVHIAMLKQFCHCNAHAKWVRQMGRRRRKAPDRDVIQKLYAEAERNCDSEHVGGGQGHGKSRIWYLSSSLLNCSGKERLPLNVNVRYGTPPPYFDVAPMGAWDLTRAPRYQHGTTNG